VDVGAEFFAEVGENVGVTDFQSEERIGGVLDELGAVDGGDEKRRVGSGRARAAVDRAAEFSLEDGAVNFAHDGGGSFVFDADDDAIGMKEIVDGSAFAKEFGIGDDLKFQAAGARVSVQGAAKLDASSCRHGAFFDDEFVRTRFGSDLAGDVVDGGEV